MKQWFLWGALGIAVSVLGFFAVRSFAPDKVAYVAAGLATGAALYPIINRGSPGKVSLAQCLGSGLVFGAVWAFVVYGLRQI